MNFYNIEDLYYLVQFLQFTLTTANWVLKYIVPIEIIDRYSAYHQISKILDSLCKLKIN